MHASLQPCVREVCATLAARIPQRGGLSVYKSRTTSRMATTAYASPSMATLFQLAQYSSECGTRYGSPPRTTSLRHPTRAAPIEDSLHSLNVLFWGVHEACLDQGPLEPATGHTTIEDA